MTKHWLKKMAKKNGEPIPGLDLKELGEQKESNRRQNDEFIKNYVDWIKSVPDAVWSHAHASFVNSQYASTHKKRV